MRTQKGTASLGRALIMPSALWMAWCGILRRRGGQRSARPTAASSRGTGVVWA